MKKIFHLPENLYVNGAPVVIESGSLIEKANGEKVAIITIRNITPKNIKAVIVSTLQLDGCGEPIGEVLETRYDNIFVGEDGLIESVEICLPTLTTQAFSVIVSEVAFSDNTLWQDAGSAWEPICGNDN